MQASDLRIGNFIRYRDKSSFLSVSNLGHFFETINQNALPYGSDDINDYNPIPLTEEILLNCEFRKSRFGATPCQFMHSIYKIGIDKVDDCFIISWGNDPINEIKYLHKLQNLVYELTGQELEVKL